MKQFFDHFSGLKGSPDGEVFVPKSGGYPEHYTYGSNLCKSHLGVCYKGKIYQVHRLIAEIFLNNNQPLPKGYVVHHINGNPEDNRVENLQILSRFEHQSLHNSERIGAKHYKSKPIIGTNVKTNEVLNFESIHLAAKTIGCSPSAIWQCLRGRNQTSGGYYWQYNQTH